ncbi:DUF6320 domain-containing protein [Longitalea luteola]|uniref:DUF6320 domain-containing protein n=1 Tax=Longitalea luteola TaxID=2812563 RepID=UPI001A972ED1|nr:DUF6320 domain-containing protein [Longitalea luteola]
MSICKNCGVELENDMQYCPLCGVGVSSVENGKTTDPKGLPAFNKAMSQPQKKFTWEIVSLVLLSCLATTIIIDLITNKRITWSEYPVTISLVIFSYVSLFAFWHQQAIIQMAGSFLLSSVFLLILDVLKDGIAWPVKLGIPLLFAGNVITAMLIMVIRLSKVKGINLIAYAFLGASLLCICIEGILSMFKMGVIFFRWSIIVAACCVPVILVLLFVHLRLKKGRSLQKTFHI